MNVNPFCLSDLVNNLTSQIILDLTATTRPNLGCSPASDSAGMVLMKLELQLQFPWGLISFTQREKNLPNFLHSPKPSILEVHSLGKEGYSNSSSPNLQNLFSSPLSF